MKTLQIKRTCATVCLPLLASDVKPVSTTTLRNAHAVLLSIIVTTRTVHSWALFVIRQKQYDYFYNLHNDNTTAVLFVKFFEIGEL